MEQVDHLYLAGENDNCIATLEMKQHFSIKLIMQLPNTPATEHLSQRHEDLLIQKHVNVQAPLFIILYINTINNSPNPETNVLQ